MLSIQSSLARQIRLIFSICTYPSANEGSQCAPRTPESKPYTVLLFGTQQRIHLTMFGKDEEPQSWEIQDQRQPSNTEAIANARRKSIANKALTGASSLTVRQSIWPITLVTILFFLWGFAVSRFCSLPTHFPQLTTPLPQSSMAFSMFSMPNSKKHSTSRPPKLVVFKALISGLTSSDL